MRRYDVEQILGVVLVISVGLFIFSLFFIVFEQAKIRFDANKLCLEHKPDGFEYYDKDQGYDSDVGWMADYEFVCKYLKVENDRVVDKMNIVLAKPGVKR